MSIDTQTAPRAVQQQPSGAPQPRAWPARRLPGRHRPRSGAVGHIDFSVSLTVIYGVIFGTLAVYIVTRVAEGRRKAADRLMTLPGDHRVRDRDGPAGVAGLHRPRQRPGPPRQRSSPTPCSGSSARAAARYHAIVGTLIVTAWRR